MTIVNWASKLTRMVRTWLGIWLVAGCATAETSGNDICEPGSTQGCLGDGCQGIQACADGGDGWLECECSAGLGGAGLGSGGATGQGGAPTDGGADGNASCEAPKQTCDGDCFDLDATPEHCGACEISCDVGQACVNGDCSESCAVGYANCDVAPGCESNTEDDETNCGACGVSCAGTCSAGQCHETETVFCWTEAERMLLDGGYAYLSGGFQQPLRRVDIATKAVTDFVIGQQALDITQNATDVFIVGFGGVGRVSKATGTYQQLASVGDAGVGQNAEATATHVYWTGTPPNVTSYSNTIRRMATSGGAVEALKTATALANDLLIAGDYMYWTEHNDGPGVFRMQLPNGSSELIIDFNYDYGTAPQSSVRHLAMVGDQIFFSYFNGGYQLASAANGGGIPSSFLTSGGTFSREIAYSASHAYFAGWRDWSSLTKGYSIWRVSLNGADETELQQYGVKGEVNSVALDSGKVYWLQEHCIYRTDG